MLRFLGRRTNTLFNGEVCSTQERRLEGVCVKHRVEENSIKMYDKQGSVLRVETILKNPSRFYGGDYGAAAMNLRNEFNGSFVY